MGNQCGFYWVEHRGEKQVALLQDNEVYLPGILTPESEQNILFLSDRLRDTNEYPEAAVRAVWEHGADTAGMKFPEFRFMDYAEEVASIFTEALQKGE